MISVMCLTAGHFIERYGSILDRDRISSRGAPEFETLQTSYAHCRQGPELYFAAQVRVVLSSSSLLSAESHRTDHPPPSPGY